MRFLAWAVVRLSFVLVPAWIVATVAAAHWLPPISGADESPLGGLVPRHAAAVRTEVREGRKFGTTLLTRVVVVQRGERRLTDDQVRATLRLAARIDRRHAPLLRHIRFVAPLVSRDRTTTVSYLYYEPSISTGARLALADTYAKRLDPPGRVTGTLPARVEEFDHIEHALPYVTLATVALIVLVLLITFRAIGPPLVGLGAAAIAYTISVRALAWIGEQRGQEVPKEVQPVLVALLLGLVTDYSIFFMAGMRRRLAGGAGRFEAAEATARDNLPIVLTAGLIVALGSLTLVVGELAVFRSFGPGIAVAVLIALAVALTFIPGALALLGPAVFWPSLGRGEREERNRPLRFLARRSWAAIAAIAVVAALGLAAAQASQMRLGFTLLRGQPADSDVKRGAEDAARGFGAGIVAPTELLLERNTLSRKQLVSLQHELERQPGVQRVLGPADQPTGTTLPVFVTRERDAARYALVLRAEPLSASAIDILERLQHRMPQLLARSDLHETRVGYGGDTALAQQTVTAIRDDALRVGLAVLAVNLVLLALFLRAIAAPLYLLAASVLALGAALGVTTWVFQDLLGHDDLTYYVPFAAGVLLLSLGSDYNVFVVGRIWQEARERPLREAIAVAVPRASRTITIAGVTLAGSFALLALVPIRPMRELAFAMSFGILLDTFIVRSLLVPSLLALLGREQRREPPQELRDRERPAHA
jgi:putative drug exporter of the RND superfamily